MVAKQSKSEQSLNEPFSNVHIQEIPQVTYVTKAGKSVSKRKLVEVAVELSDTAAKVGSEMLLNPETLDGFASGNIWVSLSITMLKLSRVFYSRSR